MHKSHRCQRALLSRAWPYLGGMERGRTTRHNRPSRCNARDGLLPAQGGLTFERTFALIESEADDLSVRRAAGVLGERMRSGGFMSEYISDFPDLFPPVARVLIWAGEQAGNFYDTLGMIANRDAEILPAFRTSNSPAWRFLKT